jgi:hypothetical protein
MSDKSDKDLLYDRIDYLSAERARFLLKLLVIADHVSPWIMERSVALAETVKESL